MTKSKRSRRGDSDPYQPVRDIARPLPRLSVRGRLGTNTIINGNEACSGIVSDGAGQASGSALLVPGFTADLNTSAVSNIAQYYSTARFLPGTTFHYVPQVSLSTSGILYTAYSDNVEVISAYMVGNNAARVNIVRQQANVKVSPVWSTISIALPSSMRRKMFDVNQNCNTASTDELDRSAQGLFMYALDGVPNGSNICRPWVHKKLQLEGLKMAST